MPNKKKNKAPKKQAGLKISYPEQLQFFYSNYAHFTMSGFDLTIDFGIRQENNVQMSSRVIVSPQHAKAMVNRLSELLNQYEKDFGEIRTEPKKK
jgi:hypothetical protein